MIIGTIDTLNKIGNIYNFDDFFFFFGLENSKRISTPGRECRQSSPKLSYTMGQIVQQIFFVSKY